MFSTSRELKQQAKSRLRERILPMMVVAAIFIVADYLISMFSSELSGRNDWIRQMNGIIATYSGELQEAVNDPEAVQAILLRIYGAMPSFREFISGRSLFGPVLSVLVSLISVPLSAGYAYHVLQESRRHNTTVGCLMHGFKVTFKTIAISLLTGLLVGLGFLLFIVPGVVLSLRYSQAVFVLMDDPDKGPVQCMKESARLMSGRKWDLFKLYFSFLLWFIAANLVTGLLGAPVLNIYLTPYLNLSAAFFYNELTGYEEPGPEPINF